MAKARRRHTREFKLLVLRELSGGKTLGELSREHGIHPTMICRWKTEYEADPGRAFSGNGHAYKEAAKIAELERVVGQLYAENAFLKKVLSSLETRLHQERRRDELI